MLWLADVAHALIRRITIRTAIRLLPRRGLTTMGKNGDTGALPERATHFIRSVEKELSETIRTVAHDALGRLDVGRGCSPIWVG